MKTAIKKKSVLNTWLCKNDMWAETWKAIQHHWWGRNKKKKKTTTWYFYMSIRNDLKGKLTTLSAVKNVKASISQIPLVGDESAPAPLQSHLQLHMALKTHIPHNPTSPLLVFIRVLGVCTHLSEDIHSTSSNDEESLCGPGWVNRIKKAVIHWNMGCCSSKRNMLKHRDPGWTPSVSCWASKGCISYESPCGESIGAIFFMTLSTMKYICSRKDKSIGPKK